jgi:hypothetical protein
VASIWEESELGGLQRLPRPTELPPLSSLNLFSPVVPSESEPRRAKMEMAAERQRGEKDTEEAQSDHSHGRQDGITELLLLLMAQSGF